MTWVQWEQKRRVTCARVATDDRGRATGLRRVSRGHSAHANSSDATSGGGGGDLGSSRRRGERPALAGSAEKLAGATRDGLVDSQMGPAGSCSYDMGPV